MEILLLIASILLGWVLNLIVPFIIKLKTKKTYTKNKARIISVINFIIVIIIEISILLLTNKDLSNFYVAPINVAFIFINTYILKLDIKQNTKKFNYLKLAVIISTIFSILTIGTLLLVSVFQNKDNKIQEDILSKEYEIIEIKTKEEFLSIKNDKNYSIVVVIYDYCPYCDSLLPIVKDFSNEYQLKSYTINIDVPFFEELDLNIESTPYTIIFKNNNLIGSNRGYMERYDYRDFLRQNNVIE